MKLHLLSILLPVLAFAQAPIPDMALYMRAKTAIEKLPDSEDKIAIADAFADLLSRMNEQPVTDGPFVQWMTDSILTDTTGAEITSTQAQAIMTGVEIKKQDGTTIPWKTVTLVTPSGVRVMGDSGISVIPFITLNQQARLSFGWTPAIQTEYETRKSAITKAGAVAVAKARSTANLQENQAYSRGLNQVQRAAPATLPATVAASNAAIARDDIPADVQRQIQAKAMERYPTDPSMRAYTEKSQRKGYDRVVYYTEHGADGAPLYIARQAAKDAAKDYPGDFEMQAVRIEHLIEQYRREKK